MPTLLIIILAIYIPVVLIGMVYLVRMTMQELTIDDSTTVKVDGDGGYRLRK